MLDVTVYDGGAANRPDGRPISQSSRLAQAASTTSAPPVSPRRTTYYDEPPTMAGTEKFRSIAHHSGPEFTSPCSGYGKHPPALAMEREPRRMGRKGRGKKNPCVSRVEALLKEPRPGDL